MSNWLYANEEPTAPWRGVLSVPRELALRRGTEGVRLAQAPIRELRALRASAEPRVVSGTAELPPSAEIELEVPREGSGEAGVRLANAAGEEVTIGVDRGRREVFVDRRRSRATPFHDAYPGRHAGPMRWRDDRALVRVLFDRTTLEVFASDGETVISDRVYPTRPFERIEVRPGEGGRPGTVRLWELRSVWN
jgi:sucrose-6-phosphate hydrolase SacC (GH32 family)